VPDQRPSAESPVALEELSDDDLLMRCRTYPRHSTERAAACEVLVRRYTPLVRACARQYMASPEPADDLMQVGFIGLRSSCSSCAAAPTT
jgi:DNA-directed RNA polymerase specialized sigma subunit